MFNFTKSLILNGLSKFELNISRGFRKWNDPKGIYKYEYKYKNLWSGGLLPRTDEKTFDEIVPLPKPKTVRSDPWSEKNATFGQNDYIDILGNGNVKPVDLMRGPKWLIGFKGNELQRLQRQVKVEGREIHSKDPEKYNKIKLRVKYLRYRYNFKFGGKRK